LVKAGMGKRIAIAAIGTHGDVQPFVALATALRKRGYSVVIGTTGDFESFVLASGVEFHNLGSDVQAFVRKAEFDNAMSKSLLLYAPALLAKGQKLLEKAAIEVWRMAQGADAVIFHMNTTFAIDVAEALDIPAIMTAFQPLNKTAEFPYFGVEAPKLDPALNKLTYVVQAAQQTYFDMPRNRLRDTLLGLRRRRHTGFAKDSHGDSLPTLHAYSHSISPRPHDWPRSAVVTGFWRLEEAPWTPPADLLDFLDAGDPPVYIGFGSMPFGAHRNSRIVNDALRLWGGRALIGQGWGGVRPAEFPGRVFSVARAPHLQLFERVSAVVHHGGAGTTYAGLYCGRPTLVVPQFFDQPYWGRRVHALGCGPAPVRLRKLTPQVLAEKLDELTTTQSFAEEARALQKKLKAEDGCARAVEVIESAIVAHPTRSAVGEVVREAPPLMQEAAT
jgi:UDP:flavonoid glycosyltransferase YjiC (YdhE family)